MDIVAIGASAGGVQAISELLKQLPPDLPATVLVVLHRPAGAVSYLPQILAAATPLEVVVAHGGETLRPGRCIVAPPDRHMTLGPDLRLHLLPDASFRAQNIDVLFRSLARHAGARTIGVVLSGMLRDGTQGLAAIKAAGGLALVQSPAQAAFPGMPMSAIGGNGTIDLVGSLEELAREIRRLSRARRALGLPA